MMISKPLSAVSFSFAGHYSPANWMMNFLSAGWRDLRRLSQRYYKGLSLDFRVVNHLGLRHRLLSVRNRPYRCGVRYEGYLGILEKYTSSIGLQGGSQTQTKDEIAF
jgi:hypothetical protein